jgi:hypothetical protein
MCHTGSSNTSSSGSEHTLKGSNSRMAGAMWMMSYDIQCMMTVA